MKNGKPAKRLLLLIAVLAFGALLMSACAKSGEQTAPDVVAVVNGEEIILAGLLFTQFAWNVLMNVGLAADRVRRLTLYQLQLQRFPALGQYAGAGTCFERVQTQEPGSSASVFSIR
ncbi:MAG: hypothetical protein IBX71_03220 [Candidatus Desulforudis sp.]|nr:hypothetical protein [Desulforudis sp.]